MAPGRTVNNNHQPPPPSPSSSTPTNMMGTTWLLVATCGCCCLATAIFMRRAQDLMAENQQLREATAFLIASHTQASSGTEDNGKNIDLLAQVATCLSGSLAGRDNSGAMSCPAGGISGDADDVVLNSDEIAWRILVGMMLVAAVAFCAFVYRQIDSLPWWLNSIGYQVLGGLHREAMQPGETRVPLSKLIAYRLDRWFSTNPYSKILALLYLTLAIIFTGGLGIFTLSTVNMDVAIWEAVAGVGVDWTFPADADPDETDSGLRVVMVRLMALLVSIGGMLVTALMLGIVSDAIGDKVDQMKRGKSEVLETDHTLILGWSDKLFGLIKELINANESMGGGAIVIMSEREKEDMEVDIESQEFDLCGSWIICRNGNPLLSPDLNKVSVRTARSIVILAQQVKDGSNADVADAFSLRIVMSLMSIHQQQPGGLRGHIVAEVCDLDNEHLLQMVASSHSLETVVAHDVIGRLMIQSRKQPGLAAVWEDLLGFEGNEFYARSWPTLAGQTFRQALLSFPDAIPVGVLSCKNTKRVLLNPEDDYVLDAEDQVLVLAEDDDTYSAQEMEVIKNPQPLPAFKETPMKERILFLGWRRDMDDMIEVLDEFVFQGSELWLYSEVPLDKREEMLIKGGLDPNQLQNLKLVYKTNELIGELTDRNALKKVHPENFSTILILADESENSTAIADADSRALATLLLVREIQSQYGMPGTASPKPEGLDGLPWYHKLASKHTVENCIVISEILDSRTRHLISELNISEYVMSNEIISSALAMVSEDANVNQILRELFTEEGNELYVHTASRYLYPGETVSFFELVGRARERKEIVLGYKNLDMARPLLNPPNKADRTISLQTTELVVVLAEEDAALEAALSCASGVLTPRSSRRSRSRASSRLSSPQESMRSLVSGQLTEALEECQASASVSPGA